MQEGFLRLHRAREGGERIESPRAYLSTVVSRLSLDQLRSARVRRETYVGEWLPEPLVASADDDPARKAEMADSLSLAFLVLLDQTQTSAPFRMTLVSSSSSITATRASSGDEYQIRAVCDPVSKATGPAAAAAEYGSSGRPRREV